MFAFSRGLMGSVGLLSVVCPPKVEFLCRSTKEGPSAPLVSPPSSLGRWTCLHWSQPTGPHTAGRGPERSADVDACCCQSEALGLVKPSLRRVSWRWAETEGTGCQGLHQMSDANTTTTSPLSLIRRDCGYKRCMGGTANISKNKNKVLNKQELALKSQPCEHLWPPQPRMCPCAPDLELFTFNVSQQQFPNTHYQGFNVPLNDKDRSCPLM